jgi:hypothetical protein
VCGVHRHRAPTVIYLVVPDRSAYSDLNLALHGYDELHVFSIRGSFRCSSHPYTFFSRLPNVIYNSHIHTVPCFFRALNEQVNSCRIISLLCILLSGILNPRVCQWTLSRQPFKVFFSKKFGISRLQSYFVDLFSFLGRPHHAVAVLLWISIKQMKRSLFSCIRTISINQ